MLELHDICKEYKTGNLVQVALDKVSINFKDNEFVAILGPSGSGKTTLLNIIGGLDGYDSGDLLIDDISTKKYRDKDWGSYRNHTIGFVFQSYNLIMHQTILANVELALTISGVSKNERREKALKALDEVGLKEQAHKKPNQLSGGQMQRVAIARALVNDPKILLADEPTGALDSNTSIQVMDLLKEVAKDRLVIMVTHNPELAYEYATRIIELKDGHIISDSDPYEAKQKPIKEANMGKSSMSFLTALSLSFSNLKTKKARTILTAFAGSIGIIGIALILSLSTGVSDYISDIEEDTLSEYPLMIQSSSFNVAGMMEETVGSLIKEKADDEIGVSEMITSMFTKIGANDLGSLMDDLKANEDALKPYIRAIEYEYDIEPLIYSTKTENIHKVNPDETFNSLGLGTNASSNAMMSSMMSTNFFYQMPENEELYIDQYTLEAGKWPEKYNECVLVLTPSGNVTDFVIYALDLKDYSELETMVDDFANGDTSNEVSFDNYSYDDFLNKKFKIVLYSDLYEYDESLDVYIDKSDDEEYLKGVIEQSEDLTIVGIVKPKESDAIAMLSSGINYLPSLNQYIAQKAMDSDILQKQLAEPNIDVFTGQGFGSDTEADIDISSFFSIDSDILESAFSIDQEVLEKAIEDIDMESFDLDFNSIINDIELADVLRGIDLEDIGIKGEEMMRAILVGYNTYLEANPVDPDNALSNKLFEDLKALVDQLPSDPGQGDTETGPSEPPQTDESQMTQEEFQVELERILNEYTTAIQNAYMASFENYANSSDGQATIDNAVTEFMDSTDIVRTLRRNINRIVDDITPKIEKMITDNIEKIMLEAVDKFAEVFPDALKIDTSKIKDAFKMNIDAKELSEIITAQIISAQASYENNLERLGYVDEDEPSAINIYPTNFEAKDQILNYLDDYNARVEESEPEKVINYTDYVGALMSSVTTIIDVISYVLIAFVAISLVVSSIMIGVITYISVLERKKEIGILRAIGASKGNISAVFNAETFIIGLLSGLIGVGISYLALFPANAIIHDIAGTTDINAKLPVMAAIALAALSTILTMIGGFIPSKQAARQDPVEALRTE